MDPRSSETFEIVYHRHGMCEVPTNLQGHSFPLCIYADYQHHCHCHKHRGNAPNQVQPGEPLEARNEDHRDHADHADCHCEMKRRHMLYTWRKRQNLACFISGYMNDSLIHAHNCMPERELISAGCEAICIGKTLYSL